MKKNIIANFVGKFWSLLSNFLFIPIYINLLGFESYSVISFTLVIAGLMAILDAGLTATLSREFARTDNDKIDKIAIFKTLEASYIVLISICILLIFFGSDFIATEWIVLKEFSPKELSLFLKILSFDIGFQLLMRFYTGGLLGLEKQIKANFYQVGWGIIRNGAVIILIFLYPRLNLFFLWQAISTIIFAFLIKISLSKELVGIYSFHFSYKIETKIFKRIWKFAGGMMLISIVAAFNTQMDKITISKLLSLESLGYYTLAISLSQGIVVIVSPIATAVLPRFTALYSEGKIEIASTLFSKISLYVSIIVFSIGSNIAFFAKDLIWVWTAKADLAEQAAPFLPIIAFSMSMLAIASLSYHIAIANGYTMLNNIMGIASLIITLPGYYFATKTYGAIGAALIFCVVQVITTFTYLFFINKKFIKKNIVKEIYGRQIILPLLIIVVISFILSKVVLPLETNRFISFILIGLVTFATFIITLGILVPLQELKSWVNFNKNNI